jgi:hypothetical protein
MKHKLSTAFLLLVALIQPWPGVIARQDANKVAASSLDFSDGRMRVGEEVKAEAPDLLVADNSIRRLEFTASGLRYLARGETGIQTESAFCYRLESVISGQVSYIADADPNSILPASEGDEVFYSHPKDIVEKYHVLDARVEQTFSLDREFNSESDDLVLIGEVTTDLWAKPKVRRTHKGITFYSGEEPVLRYGPTTVVDGAHREMSAELRWEVNQLSIVIGGKWLKGAVYPVTISSLIYSVRPPSATAPDGLNSFVGITHDNTPDGQGIDQLETDGADNSILPQLAARVRPTVISGGIAPLLVPSLVLGLRHNVNQETDSLGHIAFFSARADAPVIRMDGGDEGAALHRGYEWWMIPDDRNASSASWKLPPGIALGLKHSQHQKGITVFGRDPYSGPSSFPGFKKQAGGDLGAPSGQGYYWYESTGDGFSDWTVVERLPRWSVLGLKHSINQRNKTFSWNGIVYDPANPNIAPPPGFLRKIGGDIGAPSGQGYCWYEKVVGPEVVVKPSLTVTLGRSLLMSSADNFSLDQDHDSLVDDLEDAIANVFRPYCIFDSNENARVSGHDQGKPDEPVTLFQVRPVDLKKECCFLSPLRINIRWVFLFRRDGGFGPASLCGDSHEGDNDSASYSLLSYDRGVTWTVFLAGLGDNGLQWPSNSRIEVYDVTHPIVYMSASKHHEYFTRDRDLQNSLYSTCFLCKGDLKCNDNVNGKGDRILVNLQAPAKLHGLPYNNVGEPEYHGYPFVDDLSPFYYGHFAWGSEAFYEVGPNKEKWIYDPWIR